MKIAIIIASLLTMGSAAYADSFYVSGSRSAADSCEVARDRAIFEAVKAAMEFWAAHRGSWIVENDRYHLLDSDAVYWLTWVQEYGLPSLSQTPRRDGSCSVQATIPINMHPKLDMGKPNCVNWVWNKHPELLSIGATEYCSAAGLIDADKIPNFFDCVREEARDDLDPVQNRCLIKTNSYLSGLSQLKPSLSDSDIVRIGTGNRKFHLNPTEDDLITDYQGCVRNHLQTSLNPLKLIENCSNYASLKNDAKGSHCIAEVFKNQNEWSRSEVGSVCTFNDLLPLDFNSDYNLCAIHESMYKSPDEVKKACSPILFTDIAKCHDTLVLSRQFSEKDAVQVCTANLTIKRLSEDDPYQKCVLAESFLSKDPQRIIRRCYSQTTLPPGTSCLNRVAKISDTFADNPSATEALCTGFAKVGVDSSESYTRCILRKVSKHFAKNPALVSDLQQLQYLSHKCL